MSTDAWWDIGLVLAAGAGRRYGQPKACVQLNGERLVDRAVRVLHEGGCQNVLVVLGAWIGGVSSAHHTYNPQWREGMGSSLRWGLQQLQAWPRPNPPQHKRAVISLVDLPGLSGPAVARLREEPAALAAASYLGRQGHPVLIGEQHWPALIRQLKGDLGARQFLQTRRTRLIPLDSLADGSDVDHPPA
jgi:CTP:molybdopterin cytidylyltransferase MocA